MALRWIHENPAHWDDDKARIIGGAPEGIFDARYAACERGEIVPGEWWRVQDGDAVVGYGWMDVNWGDAEILLATDEGARGRGVGSFILEQLANEASERGLNYMYNVVRTSHPDREGLTAWLKRRGFAAEDDGRLLRSIVRASRTPPPAP